MSKLINLEGMLFGKLKVIKRAENRISRSGKTSNTMWVCHCLCDRSDDFIVYSSHLRRGKSTCCSICHHEKIGKSLFIDLTGKVFGKLKVLKRVENYIQKNGRNRVVYLCRCECGEETKVRGENLKDGSSTRCWSCRNIEIGKKRLNDLTGKTFGWLRVINLHEIKNKTTFWECLCDVELGGCGNKTVVRAAHLSNRHTTSCGCRVESTVASELKMYFDKKYKSKTEYKIIKNPDTNRWLRCDIYLPRENVYIEVHGSQHYKYSEHWHKCLENFNKLKQRDKLKKEFCKNNGTYIEIDLRKIKTTDDAIIFIEKKIKNIR